MLLFRRERGKVLGYWQTTDSHSIANETGCSDACTGMIVAPVLFFCTGSITRPQQENRRDGKNFAANGFRHLGSGHGHEFPYSVTRKRRMRVSGPSPFECV